MCGIVGVRSKSREVSRYTGRFALNMLAGEQNRGKESAGIATADEKGLWMYKDVGTALEAIPANILDEHPGFVAAGHVRYSTSGDGVSKATREEMTTATTEEERLARAKNAHPFVTDTVRYGKIAIVHNGNLTNAGTIRAEMEAEHVRFETSIDTEVMLMHIRLSIDRDGLTDIQAICAAMHAFTGTFAVIVICQGRLYAFRDRFGTWPIKIAQTEKFWLVASENVAWHKVRRHEYVTKVNRGELVIIEGAEMTRIQVITDLPQPQKCSFSKTYLQSPHSTLHGKANQAAGYRTVAAYRDANGRRLFEEHPVGAGCILPMMDSGLYFAQGYAAMHQRRFPGLSVSGVYLPKDQLVGRAFQEPNDKDREDTVLAKYFWEVLGTIVNDIIYIAERLETVWIHCIDDSQVRGTTSKIALNKIKEVLQELLPADIYAKLRFAWLLASPLYKNPCFYGIDTPRKSKLAAATKTISEIQREIGADYLGYLSYRSYVELLGPNSEDFCKACFNGDYQIPIIDQELIARRDEIAHL